MEGSAVQNVSEQRVSGSGKMCANLVPCTFTNAALHEHKRYRGVLF